MTVASGVGPQ